MRKKICRLLALVPAMGLVLSGCGGGTTTSNFATESIEETNMDGGEVSLKVWGAEEDAALLEEIINSFKAEYPDTSFNFTVEGVSESDSRDSILNDVANAPDVFAFADDQLSALVASGVLKPVENSEEISSRNLAASVSAASINDKLYAYPLTADNGYFLYYNKKYIKDSDVSTMDNLLAAAEAAGKQVTLECGSGWYLYSFFGNTGLTVGVNDDGISNFCTWNSTDGNITGVDVFNAVNEIGKSPAFLSGGDSALTEGANNDTVAAGVSGVWLAVQLKEAWGDNLGAVKLPTYTCAGQQIQMSSYAGYKLVGVNSYSENLEWAAKFADWMTNEQNQTLRFQMREQGPSNLAASETPDIKSSAALSAIIQQSEFSSLQRVGGAFWSPSGNLGNAMISGDTGGLSIQDFLDKIVGEITASNS